MRCLMLMGMKLPANLLAALVLCLPFAALASDPPLRVVDAVDLTQVRGPMVRGREAAQQVSGSLHR